MNSAGPSRAGSRTVNVLPRPGPSLEAVTLPPCISTSFWTMVSPMPSPPPTGPAPVPLGEQVEDAREQLGPDADARVGHPDDGVARVPARPPARSGRPARCTWPRC